MDETKKDLLKKAGFREEVAAVSSGKCPFCFQVRDGRTITRLPFAAPFGVGDRIELVHMPNDPCPIEPGSRGTVTHITHLQYEPAGWQVGVKWDSGRTLSLLVPPDEARLVE